jgi:hypothetical protein
MAVHMYPYNHRHLPAPHRSWLAEKVAAAGGDEQTVSVSGTAASTIKMALEELSRAEGMRIYMRYKTSVAEREQIEFYHQFVTLTPPVLVLILLIALTFL